MDSREITEALKLLDPIGLDDIGSVKLMNRVDTKYIVPLHKVKSLIGMLDGNYKVLEINNLRALPYTTIYFDTADFLFYYQHIMGKPERYKVRYRTYESSDISYLETKKKNSRQRTVKCRIVNSYKSGSLDNEALDFISRHVPVDPMILKPALLNKFTRITLVGLQTLERVTIDYYISYSELTKGGAAELPYLAIVELKKDGFAASSPFNRIIRQLNIYPKGFSKYCIGSALLNEDLKKSQIKRKFLLLNKVRNEYMRSGNTQ